ncbi:head-tail connector protein [Chelativorans sp. Marseille-P2723]|uniref:head-tail connector protein n=1 Tax=Chelativorans sp. Marseille-P2723 TaxID=2709133 RepID=UPI00157014EA|nr:head-tail connector protein [Chelativorans sp. Marseille-P2723]
MHRPVRITPPAIQLVTLAEAKLHLRVDHDDEDALISNLIQAATEHLDGWTGILGRCLVEQVWRQDHDRFARELAIPLGPVISVQTVTWRDPAGQLSTIPSGCYDLRTDEAGNAMVRFDADYVFPENLHESRAVGITFKAGYESNPGPPATSTVPDPLKVAILLLVGHWYQNREAVSTAGMASLPFAVEALIAPYRRMQI